MEFGDFRRNFGQLEFSTLDDAVESILAPTKRFGMHAPVVEAAIKGGIQAAFLVRRFEEGKSHHHAVQVRFLTQILDDFRRFGDEIWPF